MNDPRPINELRMTPDLVAVLDQVQAAVREIETSPDEDARPIKGVAADVWANNLDRLGPFTDRDKALVLIVAAVMSEFVEVGIDHGETPRDAASSAHTTLAYYLLGRADR